MLSLPLSYPQKYSAGFSQRKSFCPAVISTSSIPIRSTPRASQTSWAFELFHIQFPQKAVHDLVTEYNKTTCSQCKPLSLAISSLDYVKPGISPPFFIQNRAQNDLEKKNPSTTAKAISLSTKQDFELIHVTAHSAFCFTYPTYSIAPRRYLFSLQSLTYASKRKDICL